jgi:hypothetical protein
VGLERGPLSPCDDNWGATWKKSSGSTEINNRGDPPRRPRDTPLSAKVGTKFRKQVAVAQWVQFAFGQKSMEFFLCVLYLVNLNLVTA